MSHSNVLLVDDDEIYLFIATKILKVLSNRLKIETFTDGEQALQFIRRCITDQELFPEVILLDVNMPFMDGWGFLTEFKKLRPLMPNEQVQIYLVTSSDSEEDKRRASEFEMLTGYIVKPISKDKLKVILQAVYDENFDNIK